MKREAGWAVGEWVYDATREPEKVLRDVRKRGRLHESLSLSLLLLLLLLVDV